MLESAIDEKRRRDKLKAKRNRLFERFLDNPANTSLALEIKSIDDRVAEYTQQRANSKNLVILSKPFKLKQDAEKAREKYPERERRTIGIGRS